MESSESYQRLALDCLKVAQRAHDPATRDDMRRLAHLWVRLAHQVRVQRTRLMRGHVPVEDRDSSAILE